MIGRDEKLFNTTKTKQKTHGTVLWNNRKVWLFSKLPCPSFTNIHQRSNYSNISSIDNIVCFHSTQLSYFKKSVIWCTFFSFLILLKGKGKGKKEKRRRYANWLPFRKELITKLSAKSSKCCPSTNTLQPSRRAVEYIIPLFIREHLYYHHLFLLLLYIIFNSFGGSVHNKEIVWMKAFKIFFFLKKYSHNNYMYNRLIIEYHTKCTHQLHIDCFVMCSFARSKTGSLSK